MAIPTVYCASFVVAYYGPNAEVLGNVKKDYWQYDKVDNLMQKLNNIVIAIFIDALRGLIFQLVLWRFCRLNMYRTYGYIVQRYGIVVVPAMGSFLNLVMCSIIILLI